MTVSVAATIADRIARLLEIRVGQAEAAVRLLDEGATVPFIARYRKEATDGLDDEQLRTLEERLQYLRDLDARKETVLGSIKEQGKLSAALEAKILEAETKARVEDLYLPYKPKRRTKAQDAREAGLAPLAELLLRQPYREPETEARAFLKPEKGVTDANAALEGARHILVERLAEDADLLARLRSHVARLGWLRAKVIKGKEQDGLKFSDYFDYAEPLQKAPSHRVLALLRGAREEILRIDVAPDRAALEGKDESPCETAIARHFRIMDKGRPGDAWLLRAVSLAWKSKIMPRLKLDLLSQLRETAEEEAIRVFARNLKDLLMAAPAGSVPTLGLDPGLRTGVKLTVVDETGKVVAHDTIYPHPPHRRWDAAMTRIAGLCAAHGVGLIAIGNGTGGRETDRLVQQVLERHPEIRAEKIMVSEAGASVYSASALASAELPDLDVSIRGAVSIARRLQDPLAELVKIDPKSIGVGQYQHDVNQTKLARCLDGVIEDCVNAVGVDVNTASAPLLTRVSGLTPSLAQNIVTFREGHGRFRKRDQLKQVPRMGAKTFELAAGFLRVHDGDNPLDGSAVHPEAYSVVGRIAKRHGESIASLIGNSPFLKSLHPRDYTDDRFGEPTILDIFRELDKPGRDPRGEFRTAHFKEGVEEIGDLEPGMVLEGVVGNVTNFGAFVDIGVHQDGLVHISQLANRFVRDPSEIVKAGDIVKVKVLEVELKRGRVALTMRLDD